MCPSSAVVAQYRTATAVLFVVVLYVQPYCSTCSTTASSRADVLGSYWYYSTYCVLVIGEYVLCIGDWGGRRRWELVVECVCCAVDCGLCVCCVGNCVEMPLPEHLKGIFVNDRSLYDIASDLVAKGKAALPTPPSMVSVGYKAAGGIPVKYRKDVVRSKNAPTESRSASGLPHAVSGSCTLHAQHSVQFSVQLLETAALQRWSAALTHCRFHCHRYLGLWSSP